ncbi:MAG TPA: hypothetical protein VJL81_07510 [Solirubrobacterales bacterium]|nr:hypothetical protein [Solirubrobacterales bacterium]
MRRPLILLVSLVATLALAVGAARAAGAGGIDRTYGEGGCG